MIAIASHNGLAAAERAYSAQQAGGDLLDALLEGIEIVEDDPTEQTVGYGGLPNSAGVVELDAGIMHGPTHRAAGVGALVGIRHPTRVARQLMVTTNRVLLVGEGARQFALAQGFREEDLLTAAAEQRWHDWQQSAAAEGDPGPPPDGQGSDVPDFRRPTGTVHVALCSSAGELACATSTSGHAFKPPGRVGDSPIVGAGFYADNDLGTCGSIGWGEANLENVASFAAVELLRSGLTPTEAGLPILRRLADKCSSAMRSADGRPNYNVRLYLLTPAGEHAGVALWGPQEYAVSDAEGTRLEPCVALYE